MQVGDREDPLRGRRCAAVEHFHGVATVVTKLLCMVQPDDAYFGRKDAQQLHMIRASARDLNLPVRILDVATVREPGGLAMSSRNGLLSAAERQRAAGLPAAIAAARAALAGGEHSAATVLRPPNGHSPHTAPTSSTSRSSTRRRFSALDVHSAARCCCCSRRASATCA